MLCRCQVAMRNTPSLVRKVHNRHFPNDEVTVNTPQTKDFEKVKKEGADAWPFYGGRIQIERAKKQSFPQILPVIDETPFDIRQRQVDKTLRFGGDSRTYSTMLVYPDGSSITFPYHKPVGTIYLPGDDKQISLGPKVKARAKRRVKVGI